MPGVAGRISTGTLPELKSPSYNGLVQRVLTPLQMSAADQAAAGAGIPTQGLMDTAGRAVGAAAIRMMGSVYGRRVTVVCGKGNNGGDGFVAASYLARRGAACNVVLLADPKELKGDALNAYRLMRGTGVRMCDQSRLAHELDRSDLALDALLGTGFKGELRGPMAQAVAELNDGAAPVLAVDIPSGVDGATGQVAGPAVEAAVTVTLAALKCGLLLQPGAQLAGDVVVVDIGIPDRLMPADLYLAGPDDLWSALPPRPVTAHKRSVGKVLVVGGSASMPGAVVLAASGALRAGAGLVRMAVPESIGPQVAPQVVEALTFSLPQTPEGGFSPEGVEQAVELAGQMQVMAIGPGIGKDRQTMDFVTQVLERVEQPAVLDADGIAAFEGKPEKLADRAGPTVMTPHSGELGRLLGRRPEEVDADRIGAAREASRRSGAVVLLKGARTVVARPDGRAVLVDAGGPVLATAGTGDVLTGVIAALCTHNDPFTAAWAGACLHGMAGETLAEWMGDRGVVAGDLLRALPLVIHEVTS